MVGRCAVSDVAECDSAQLKAADFYIDPEATPPVRSLRSQSFHSSPGVSADMNPSC